MLTEEHKRKTTPALLENLCRYQDEGESFTENIIIGDETCVYEFHLTVRKETWKHPYSPTTKKNIQN
jgi:hypothetical protein